MPKLSTVDQQHGTDDLTGPDTGGLTLHFDCVAKDPADLKLEANHRKVRDFG